jgi:probable rRNA maturation factor
MIDFHYETDFLLLKEDKFKKWISSGIEERSFKEGDLNFIFCDDAYLLKLNVEFLKHDTLTDIISFDYTLGKLLGGDVFISIPRVRENAMEHNLSFESELSRVMIHGILHYMGYPDKTDTEKAIMRASEDKCLAKLAE